jgi:hypothetical protein
MVTAMPQPLMASFTESGKSLPARTKQPTLSGRAAAVSVIRAPTVPVHGVNGSQEVSCIVRATPHYMYSLYSPEPPGTS